MSRPAFTLLLPWALVLCGVGLPTPAAEGPGPGGAVVEEVHAHWARRSPRLEVGDRVTGWRCTKDSAASGALADVTQLVWVEQTLAPACAVVLVVERDGAAVEIPMPPWRWRFSPRPALAAGPLDRVTRAMQSLAAGDVGPALAEVGGIASDLERAGRGADGVWVLCRAGRALGDAESAAASDAQYEAAVAMAGRWGEDRTVVWALRDWALSLRDQGRNEAAVAAFDRALAALGQGDRGGLMEANLQDQRAACLWNLGRDQAAEQGDRRALEIRRALAPGSPVFAGSLVNMGLTLRGRGEWAEAERLYLEALPILEMSDPGSGTVAQVLNNLGTVAYLRGDLARAERYDLQALATREKISPGTLDVARSLNNLGTVAKSRGDYAGAERYYRRALELSGALRPEGLDTANIADNLAQVLSRKGQLEEAAALDGRALEISRKAAPESMDVARVLTHLATLALAQGKLEESSSLNAEAVALKQRLLPGGLSLSYNDDVAAQVCLARNDLEGAEEALRRACALRERLAPGTTDLCESLRELALLQRRRGRPEEAAQTLDKGLANVEEQLGRLGGGQEVSQSFATSFADLYRERADLQCEAGDVEGAFQTLERFRAQSLLALLAQRDLDFGVDAPADLLERQRELRREYDTVQDDLGRLSPSRDSVEIASLQERLAELRLERSRLADEVRRSSPRYASLKFPRPQTARESQQALPPGALLLSFCVGPERTWVIGMTRGALWANAVDVPRRRLALEVSALRALCGDPASEEKVLQERSRGLFRRLLEPSARRLSGRQSPLILCPDGPLHALPWSALHDGTRYLMETAAPFTVPSATAFAQMAGSHRVLPSPTPIVAFADPQPVPRLSSAVEGQGSLPALPAAREEVSAICALFGTQGKRFVGAEATEGRAWAEAPRARLLHFACHGLLDPFSPLDSALALAPGSSGAGDENGLLQAWEVFERFRLEADLVTLSACETGLGEDRGGEGVVGLARAFQYAGARCVLSSQWSISDRSTATLMTALYRQLRRGRPPAVALALAQRGLLKAPTGNTRHPFYWSGFVLDGRGDRVTSAPVR